jgi:hypothetical protein
MALYRLNGYDRLEIEVSRRAESAHPNRAQRNAVI